MSRITILSILWGLIGTALFLIIRLLGPMIGFETDVASFSGLIAQIGFYFTDHDRFQRWLNGQR